MKFGKQLMLRVQPGLESGYLDYKEFKHRIKACADKTADSDEAEQLRALCWSELDKVDSFYRTREDQAAKKTLDLQQQFVPNMPPSDLALWLREVSTLIEFLDELGDIASLNRLGFSKVLKKTEKRTPQLGLTADFQAKVHASYFSSSTKGVDLLQWARTTPGRAPQVVLNNAARVPSHDEWIAPPTATLDAPKPPTVDRLELDRLPVGQISRLWVVLAHDGLGQDIKVPVLVAKGVRVGPTLGITACLHGNELNGIPLIHRLFREINCSELNGIVVAVPVANAPGFVRTQRGYLDNADLNRLMPGKENGTAAQSYAYALMERIVYCFNYLIDMHTASTGRINSLYVRANMRHPVTARMAFLQNPQIIVHNTSPDGSLRAAAVERGIHAITVEVGDPQRFHSRFINFALLGVENVMCSLKIVARKPEDPGFEPTLCTKSFWMFTRSGGILTILPEINTWVRQGEVVARIQNVFGDDIEEYSSPADGVIVGRSVNPVCSTGDRILHLGVVTAEFSSVSEDGHL